MEMEFESEENAYQFYNEYARRTGFGIRRHYRNTSKKDGVLTSRRFSCCKEGERIPDKRAYVRKNPRAETRLGCQARMIISLDRKIGKYKVCDFVSEHNHPLQPQECIHMVRSHRNISETQALQIEVAEKSGLRIKASHELMANQVCGANNLGFTRQDHKNYLRTKRKQSLKYGEVGALLMYFQRQASENPSFFYEYQMDVEEQITNIFWADAQMINDYGHFGDVITFDTTYKTNKDYRPLGVFVGFNNHRQTVVFGATLLYDETSSSFEWLFETFLKAMGGKKPKTILTDQDAAMAKAIPLAMPGVFHALCTWHIRENALRHVNHLYQKSPNFSTKFEACIDLYEGEEEFMSGWESLLTEHNVSNDSWLHTIFQVKEKWAWAYVRETFSAGMRSTQLSESFNADLKNHLKSDINLVEFFTHFERVVSGKRKNESEAEYESRQKLPRLKMKKAPMLIQAGNVYTPKIFEEFQEDYEEFQGAYIKECKESQSKCEYIVGNVDGSKERLVVGNRLEQTVLCDCRKFETHGILCSHAIKVLDVMNIKMIPPHYILKRWTRGARLGSVKDWNGQHIKLDRKAHFTKRIRELCPRMVKLTNRASESHETYTFLSKVLEESSKMVEEMLAKESCLSEDSVGGRDLSISVRYEEPKNDVATFDSCGAKGIKKRGCSHKGRRRPKSWVEKKSKQRMRNSVQKKRNLEENMIIEENMGANSSQLVSPTDYNLPYTTTTPSSYNFTQLLTEQLDYNAVSLSIDNLVSSQYNMEN